MSSIINLADARARNIALPADDGVAQDILDEQEAWLARKIGPLTGERTETFYVGLGSSHGKLGLARYTDVVVLTDGGPAVTAFRLVDNGGALIQTYSAPSRWWTGPYVTAKYTPNDETEVRNALYDLTALAVAPPGPYASETIGSYSYSRGQGTGALAAQRAAIAAALLPKRDTNYTLAVSRQLGYGDPVINRAEPAW